MMFSPCRLASMYKTMCFLVECRQYLSLDLESWPFFSKVIVLTPSRNMVIPGFLHVKHSLKAPLICRPGWKEARKPPYGCCQIILPLLHVALAFITDGGWLPLYVLRK